MNTTRRDDADDTNENDVHELRRTHGEVNDALSSPLGKDPGPFVRDKEDVPHEDAIPDFYGLDSDASEGQVEDVLFAMVAEGTLEYGWIEERGEFGFWHVDAIFETAQEPAPEPEPVVELPAYPLPSRALHKRPRATLVRKILQGVLAAVVAPFIIGAYAYATDHQKGSDGPHGDPEMTSDDVTPDDVPGRGPAYAPLDHGHGAAVQPTPSRGRHAKPSTHPENTRPKTTRARHAKRRKASTAPSVVPTGIPTVRVKLPSQRPGLDGEIDHHSMLGTLVKTVGAALG
jgi:hypothetical protein